MNVREPLFGQVTVLPDASTPSHTVIQDHQGITVSPSRNGPQTTPIHNRHTQQITRVTSSGDLSTSLSTTPDSDRPFISDISQDSSISAGTTLELTCVASRVRNLNVRYVFLFLILFN